MSLEMYLFIDDTVFAKLSLVQGHLFMSDSIYVSQFSTRSFTYGW